MSGPIKEFLSILDNKVVITKVSSKIRSCKEPLDVNTHSIEQYTADPWTCAPRMETQCIWKFVIMGSKKPPIP